MVFPSPILARNVFGSCGLPTLLHEEILFPGRSQDHVRQSAINSGKHTAAIPTPKINILAGVTLTHFTLRALP
jgi:hypothetical protein